MERAVTRIRRAVAIAMAVQGVLHFRVYEKATILTDSKVAMHKIMEFENVYRGSVLSPVGEQLQVIAITSQQLRQRGQKLTIRWVPAHAGMEGNEVAEQT